jgi:hypothetical protein
LFFEKCAETRAQNPFLDTLSEAIATWLHKLGWVNLQKRRMTLEVKINNGWLVLQRFVRNPNGSGTCYTEGFHLGDPDCLAKAEAFLEGYQ